MTEIYTETIKLNKMIQVSGRMKKIKERENILSSARDAAILKPLMQGGAKESSSVHLSPD